MIWWQLLIQLIVTIGIFYLLANFLKQFKTEKKAFLSLFAIILVFTLGFAMRLMKNQDIIDIGYYLTDISYLFTYVLFTAALLLGQKRYWNVK